MSVARYLSLRGKRSSDAIKPAIPRTPTKNSLDRGGQDFTYSPKVYDQGRVADTLGEIVDFNHDTQGVPTVGPGRGQASCRAAAAGSWPQRCDRAFAFLGDGVVFRPLRHHVDRSCAADLFRAHPAVAVDRVLEQRVGSGPRSAAWRAGRDACDTRP